MPGRGSGGEWVSPSPERGAQRRHFNADAPALTTAKACPAASRSVCRAPFQPILQRPERSPTDTSPLCETHPPQTLRASPTGTQRTCSRLEAPAPLAGWNGVRPPPISVPVWLWKQYQTWPLRREKLTSTFWKPEVRDPSVGAWPRGCEDVFVPGPPGPADSRPAVTRFSVCARLSRFPLQGHSQVDQAHPKGVVLT